MRISGRVKWSLGIAVGAALSACGGGSAMHDQHATPGIAVGEPNPAGLATAPFIEMARTSGCSGTRNRLFVIDGRQVFWDRAGRCADALYEHALFGGTPDTRLCSHGDTIAGPKTACQDESARALFDTIVKNADQPDLGLGSGHEVEQLSIMPPGVTGIPFQTVDATSMSNIREARTVVVKDAAAWARLWSEHAPGRPLPTVDFAARMVVGVFMGPGANSCYTIAIDGVGRTADKILVRALRSVAGPDFACAMHVTTPAHLVAVPRSDLPVEFATEVVTR
jgi:hypothetical protein